MSNVHWLTRYDPDGEPYGELCHCEIGDDHDMAGNKMFLGLTSVGDGNERSTPGGPDKTSDDLLSDVRDGTWLSGRTFPPDWAMWKLDPDDLYLETEDYSVNLRECTTSARVLDWIFQVAGKEWASDTALAGFVRALGDILDPQRNLCPFGDDNTITVERIAALVKRAAGTSAERPATAEVGMVKVGDAGSDGNGRSTASLTLEAMVDAAADRLTRGEFESKASYDRCGETLCTSDAWGVARAVLDAAGVPAMVAEREKTRAATGGDDPPRLWAIHVTGPFEILAAVPSREAAEAAAEPINARKAAGGASTAEAVPWPGTPEQHAADLDNWEPEIDEEARGGARAETTGGDTRAMTPDQARDWARAAREAADDQADDDARDAAATGGDV